jgi:hypothetical protein
VVKQTPWIFVLLLLVSVVFASAVPPMDDPETAFNEADSQVSLASSPRINLLGPAASSTPQPMLHPVRRPRSLRVHKPVHRLAPMAKQSRPPSLQKLLCTFLI